MRNITKRKGFTLVELMIVVGIIGVLIAIAIPAYNDVTEGAKTTACAANARTIDSAIMMWQMEDPGKNVDPSKVTDDADIYKFLKGGVAPTCPSDGSAYGFEGSGSAWYAICGGKHKEAQMDDAGLGTGGGDTTED